MDSIIQPFPTKATIVQNLQAPIGRYILTSKKNCYMPRKGKSTKNFN